MSEAYACFAIVLYLILFQYFNGSVPSETVLAQQWEQVVCNLFHTLLLLVFEMRLLRGDKDADLTS